MRIKSILIIIALVLISPLFGVVLAEAVGYHEPLDLAAETLGLNDLTDALNWTPFLDYTVPGLPDEIGYIVSGLLGVAIIWGGGYVASKILLKEKGNG